METLLARHKPALGEPGMDRAAFLERIDDLKAPSLAEVQQLYGDLAQELTLQYGGAAPTRKVAQ